ncbi:acylphosphatase [Nanoarchaeota archaeon]
MDKRAKMIITGKVQGVYFRNFAKQNANKLGLVGWVKNRKDGALEVVVQGAEAKIEQFHTLCKSGPMMAKVEEIGVEWLDLDEDLEYFDLRSF